MQLAHCLDRDIAVGGGDVALAGFARFDGDKAGIAAVVGGSVVVVVVHVYALYAVAARMHAALVD